MYNTRKPWKPKDPKSHWKVQSFLNVVPCWVFWVYLDSRFSSLKQIPMNLNNMNPHPNPTLHFNPSLHLVALTNDKALSTHRHRGLSPPVNVGGLEYRQFGSGFDLGRRRNGISAWVSSPSSSSSSPSPSNFYGPPDKPPKLWSKVMINKERVFDLKERMDLVQLMFKVEGNEGPNKAANQTYPKPCHSLPEGTNNLLRDDLGFLLRQIIHRRIWLFLVRFHLPLVSEGVFPNYYRSNYFLPIISNGFYFFGQSF